jgi:hypothetical protein
MGNVSAKLGLGPGHSPTEVTQNLTHNLAASMAIAGFYAVSWYIAIELITRAFLKWLSQRRPPRGAYFWSGSASTAGILCSPLFNLLMDFGVAKSQTGAILAVVFR